MSFQTDPMLGYRQRGQRGCPECGQLEGREGDKGSRIRLSALHGR